MMGKTFLLRCYHLYFFWQTNLLYDIIIFSHIK
jgi:hypothetical protein